MHYVMFSFGLAFSQEYNFVLEFRDLHKAHVENQRNSVEAAPRSLSR